MAHGSEAVPVGEPSWAGLAGDLKAFAELHGGAKAIIEYLGKRGVQIALMAAMTRSVRNGRAEH